jgi:glycosyltransferase involved in cell wall biosynthesis
VIRGASIILCTSRQEETSIKQLGYRTPTAVIPIGIDWESLRRPGSAEILSAAGIDRDSRVVTFLGRVSRLKRVDLLVEAFKHIAATMPDARLVIAGPDDGGFVHELTRLAAYDGIRGRVSFVGPVVEEQKRALLQRSDVLVLPSPGEGFGLAAAEAMAVGCPVVVSPDVALQDLVSESGAGLIAERDPSDIARAIGAILQDRSAAAKMSEAAKSVVERQLSWPVVARQLESMYSDVIRAS